MNRINISFPVFLLSTLLLLGACSNEENIPVTEDNLMRFDVWHPGETRATANKFDNADKIGLFVTETTEPLQVSGNYVNNTLLTYDGTAWKSTTPVYYNKGTYHVYAYYPYNAAVTSVDDYPFGVSFDQNTTKNGSILGGYEASDFLWASKKNVTASASSVPLQFAHRMSKVVVRLIKGDDYEGDIPTDAVVYIHNTVTSSTIDMAAGVATVNPYGQSHSIKARNEGKLQYSAIVVPQRLNNRLPLVEVMMKGVSYMMESTFVFKPGIQHTLSLVISRNPEQVKIEIGGEIENWN